MIAMVEPAPRDLPAMSLRVGMEVEVSFGEGPVWRRVDDVMLLNHGRSGVMVWIDAPEAQEDAHGKRRLAVTLRQGVLVSTRGGR